MKYKDFLNLVEETTGSKPTHAQISQILGGRPTANALSNRLSNNGNLSSAELVILKGYYAKFQTCERLSEVIETRKVQKKSPDEFGEKLREHSYKIMYWSECERFGNLLKKPSITEWVTDLQGIVLDWGANPENLCIIAMPGEEMDNGGYSIRNNDILIVDMSRKNITESGIFFYSTLKGTKVFVRRLLEQMHGDVTVTVDNSLYAPMVNRTFTQEELDSIDFTVIGRVIKNMSLKL